jgi:hypothetical protein
VTDFDKASQNSVLPAPAQGELPLHAPPATSDEMLVPARTVNEWVYCPRLAFLEWSHGEWARRGHLREMAVNCRSLAKATVPTKSPGALAKAKHVDFAPLFDIVNSSNDRIVVSPEGDRPDGSRVARFQELKDALTRGDRSRAFAPGPH